MKTARELSSNNRNAAMTISLSSTFVPLFVVALVLDTVHGSMSDGLWNNSNTTNFLA
ncbi:hypothetical protein ACHAXS_000494, partial [Conticribra weissflogii]